MKTAAGQSDSNAIEIPAFMTSSSVEPVDILAFGPHPDDIEIGIGGTLAKHAANGRQCGHVRSDGRRDGQQRHRGRETRRSRSRSGRAWRAVAGQPAITRSRHRQRSWHTSGWRPNWCAVPGRVWSLCRIGPIDIRITLRPASLLTEAVFSAGLRRYPAAGEAWKPESICYYFINDAAPPSFVIDVSDHYETKRRALACHASSVPSCGVPMRWPRG